MRKELTLINSKIVDSRSELSDLYDSMGEYNEEIIDLINELEGDLFNAESTMEKLLIKIKNYE